jgi:S-formylglutathione hydrolase FrmB
LTTNFDFCPKVGLVGLSRGGLYCYNWAIANPHKVACIYGDAPVCDFRSWPGGFGAGPGSPKDWQLVLKLWKFESDDAAKHYQGNPVDNLQPLARAGVPILHVYGDADEVVPWQENTGLVADRYREFGGSFQQIRKAGVKHHPHGLEDPTPIVDFLFQHCSSPIVELHIDDTTSTRTADPAGFIVHRLRSPYQNDTTELKVLLPDSLGQQTAPSNSQHSILFVLPVEQQQQTRWGDGLAEVKKLDLHNRLQLVCIEPGFAGLPWYADHPSDSGIRQESYLLRSVLPILRWLYPEARHDRDGRLLVGFSKSGFGAWSLLLRNPHVFGRAAAWDAPLALSEPGKYGSAAIFGDSTNFHKYNVSQLLRINQAEFRFVKDPSKSNVIQPRLIHAGYDNFRSEHQQIESLLNELEIPHLYHDGPQRAHHWSSGWLEQLVEDLVAKASS